MKRFKYVYALRDPRTAEVRYVGLTSGTLNARLSHHVTDARRGKPTAKDEWVRELLAAGLRPTIDLLELSEARGGFGDVDHLAVEERWIRKFRVSGRLLNERVATDVQKQIDREARFYPDMQFHGFTTS